EIDHEREIQTDLCLPLLPCTSHISLGIKESSEGNDQDQDNWITHFEKYVDRHDGERKSNTQENLKANVFFFVKFLTKSCALNLPFKLCFIPAEFVPRGQRKDEPMHQRFCQPDDRGTGLLWSF